MVSKQKYQRHQSRNLRAWYQNCSIQILILGGYDETKKIFVYKSHSLSHYNPDPKLMLGSFYLGKMVFG